MIVIDYQKPYFTLEFPYNKRELNIVRELPVREWDNKQKKWKVPGLCVKTLESLPEDTFWSKAALKVKRGVERRLIKLVDYKFQEGQSDSWMRPYQVVGSEFLLSAGSALLADDPGLGKTAQSIQAILKAGCNRCLILCPSTLKWNWEAQFKKHFNLNVLIITGNAEQREKLWKTEYQFKIANYELLQRDWNVIPKEWDAIIADEIIYLKTSTAKRTKLAKKLTATHRIGLSGVPLENKLDDLHSIMEWVRPEVMPSFFRFRKKFCIQDHFGSVVGYKNMDDFHLLTSPFILRRKKEDVLTELPPKIYEDIPLKFDSKAAHEYSVLAGNFIKWLHDETNKEKIKFPATILEQVIRVRQFVEFPEIVGFENTENVKLTWLAELYKVIDKIVVFTPFLTSANRLRDFFKTSFVLTGEIPTSNRYSIVTKFNEAKRGIMVCTDAGRFGLDMVGASSIVHYGYFYNPGTMEQREDRLHRIGQKDVVHVFRPFIEGTIDVGIRQIYMDRAAWALEFEEGSTKMSQARLSKHIFEKLVYGEI